MPAPTCVCEICKNTVNKSQTYYTGTGRACKSHDGIVEKADLLKAKEKEIKAKEEQIKENIKQEKEKRRKRRTEELMFPNCHICTEVGILEHEFYWKLLVAMKKVELTLPKDDYINVFSISEEHRKLLRSHFVNDREMNPLYQFARDELPKFVWKKIHYDFEMVAQMVGAALLCSKCIKKYDLQNILQKKQSSTTKMSLHDMHTLGVITGVYIENEIKNGRL
jgi:hypothetical protein